MKQQNQGQIQSNNRLPLPAENNCNDQAIVAHSRQKQMAKTLIIGAINQIQEEIMNKNLIVKSQRSSEFLTPVCHKNDQNLKLTQILKKRQELNQQMARLKYEESRVKEKKRNSIDRYQRSKLTKEEIQNIKHVLSAQKRFEQQKKMKLKQLQQDITAEKLAKQQQMKHKFEQKAKKKQVQSMKHIEAIKINQTMRQETIRKRNSIYQSIKNKQFLYQQIEKKQKHQKEQQVLRQKSILENLRKQKEFNFQNIIEHEKIHKIFTTQKEAEIKQQEKEQKKKRQEMQQQIFNHYPASKFLSVLEEEEKQQHIEEEERQKQFRACLQKKIMYSQTVRELNRHYLQQSQIKLQNNPIYTKNSSHKTTRSLSLADLAKLGNTYMREVHSSIDHSPKSRNKNNQKQQKCIFKYQNYLEKARHQRMLMEQNNPETKELRELKSVMKKQAPLKQKLYLAKLISNKLQSKAGNDTRLLLESINAKISIINEFSQK